MENFGSMTLIPKVVSLKSSVFVSLILSRNKDSEIKERLGIGYGVKGEVRCTKIFKCNNLRLYFVSVYR